MILILFVFIVEEIYPEDRIFDRASSLKKEVLQTDFSVVDKFLPKEELDGGMEEEKKTEDASSQKPSSNLDPFMAFLAKDLVVTDVKTGIPYSLYRSINVLAVEERVGSTLSFILDKKGEKKFLVKTSQLLPLKEDLNLSLGKNPAITHQKPIDFHVIDYSFPVESIFSVYSETVGGGYFKNLYRRDMKRNFNLSRAEIKLFYPWIFPMRLGLAFSYQNDLLQTDDGNVSWRGFSVGPALYFTLIRHSRFDLNLHMGFLKSFLMESGSKGEYFTLSSNVFQLEMAVRFFLDRGFLVAGSSFRYQRPSIKDGNTDFLLDPYGDSLNSIGLFVGYGLDFKL